MNKRMVVSGTYVALDEALYNANVALSNAHQLGDGKLADVCNGAVSGIVAAQEYLRERAEVNAATGNARVPSRV